jgi:hypothetical protein
MVGGERNVHMVERARVWCAVEGVGGGGRSRHGECKGAKQRGGEKRAKESKYRPEAI